MGKISHRRGTCPRSSDSFSLAALANYYKVNSLHQYPFSISQPVGLSCFSAPGPTTLKSRSQQGCALASKLWGRSRFQAQSGCGQNVVPCGCRTEVPIFLLTVGWRSLLTSGGHPCSLACGLSIGRLCPSHAGGHASTPSLPSPSAYLLPLSSPASLCFPLLLLGAYALHWPHLDHPEFSL